MPVQSDHVRQHRHHAEGDGRIGDVERPEVPAAEDHVDEVDDGPERQAVDEVADGAAQNESQPHARQALVRRQPRCVERDGHQGSCRGQGHDGRLVREVHRVQEAERRARVAHVHDVQQVRDDGDAVVDRNPGPHEQLGQLIERDDAGDEGEFEQEAARRRPAPSAAAAGLVCHRAAASASSHRGHTPSRPAAADTAGT